MCIGERWASKGKGLEGRSQTTFYMEITLVCASIRTTTVLLYMEIIILCCESHKEHVYTPRGDNTEF